PPAVIARVPPYELRPLGVNLRRAVPLREGALHAVQLEAMRALAPEEAMRRMRTLRGVGVWTANVVAMRALSYTDGVLVGDSGAPFLATMALTGVRGGDE